jgi:hypothetical protein
LYIPELGFQKKFAVWCQGGEEEIKKSQSAQINIIFHHDKIWIYAVEGGCRQEERE